MLKVFIVEDEPLIRDSLRKMLADFEESQHLQYCGEAGDGEIALSMIQELKPDILMTDIRMPFMDGLTLARYAKELLPWLHVIIITGFEEFAYTKEAIDIGVYGYITKPVQKNELAEVFERIRSRREQRSAKEAAPFRLESLLNQELYKEHFFNKLKSGNYTAADIYEREKRLNVDFLGRTYGIMTAILRPKTPDKTLYHEVLKRLAPLFDNDRQVLLTVYDDFRISGLVTASDQQQVVNKCYFAADILSYELKKCGITDFNLYIGPRTGRISEVGGLLEWTESSGKIMPPNFKQTITELDAVIQAPTEFVDQSYYLTELKQDPLPVDTLLKEAENRWQKLASSDEQKHYRFEFLALLKTRLQESVSEGSLCPAEEYSDDQLKTIAETESLTRLTGRLFLESLAKQQSFTVKDTSLSRVERLIQDVTTYMQEHFADPDLSLQTMADRLQISTAYLSTLFSQNEGVTFIEYLTRLRMEKAKALLAETNQKIIDITFEVGYNDPNYFSFTFKKRNQLTPKEYRNQVQSR